MSGRWRIDPSTPDKHDHLVIETADHRFALCDPRRFGFVDLVDTAALEQWPAFAAMGPGAARPGLDAGAPAGPRSTAASRRSSCCCSTSGSSPGSATSTSARRCSARGSIRARRLGRVGRAALDRLVPAIREVLEQAIGDGGSTLRDYAQPDGELGYFATRFAVYDREGSPARAATAGSCDAWCRAGAAPGSARGVRSDIARGAVRLTIRPLAAKGAAFRRETAVSVTV